MLKIPVHCRADCRAGCRSIVSQKLNNPLILLDFSFSDNNDNRNIKEKMNSKKRG